MNAFGKYLTKILIMRYEKKYIKKFVQESTVLQSVFTNAGLDEFIEQCLGRNADGLYQCLYCHFSSLHKQHVKNHCEAKHVSGGVVCPNCGMTCSTRKTLAMHMSRKHVNSGVFQCFVCSCICPTREALAMHMSRKHVNSSGFQCLVCSYICPTREALRKHMTSMHKPVSSELDQEVGALMRRGEGGGWECCSCDWTTRIRARLWEHVESAHTQSTGYSCPICDKFCSSFNAYKTHKSRYHKQNQPARSESGDMGNVEVTLLNYGPGKPGVEAKRLPSGEVQYSCLLCNSQQKYIASHVKKKHASMFQNEELEEFQGSLKKFANAAKYNKCESKEKKRDLEGFKKAKRESRSRSRGERTAEDSVADRDKDKIRKRSKKSNNNPEKFQEEDKIDGKARENHQIMQVLNIL